jgi:hypothetical protein
MKLLAGWFLRRFLAASMPYTFSPDLAAAAIQACCLEHDLYT